MFVLTLAGLTDALPDEGTTGENGNWESVDTEPGEWDSGVFASLNVRFLGLYICEGGCGIGTPFVRVDPFVDVPLNPPPPAW